MKWWTGQPTRELLGFLSKRTYYLAPRSAIIAKTLKLHFSFQLKSYSSQSVTNHKGAAESDHLCTIKTPFKSNPCSSRHASHWFGHDFNRSKLLFEAPCLLSCSSLLSFHTFLSDHHDSLKTYLPLSCFQPLGLSEL